MSKNEVTETAINLVARGMKVGPVESAVLIARGLAKVNQRASGAALVLTDDGWLKATVNRGAAVSRETPAPASTFMPRYTA